MVSMKGCTLYSKTNDISLVHNKLTRKTCLILHFMCGVGRSRVVRT